MEAAKIAIELVLLGIAWAILYTYVIYPVMASFVGNATYREPGRELTSISMLVPSYNEEASIADKIANFREIDYPVDRIELVIADDGSDDETAAIVEANQCERVRLIRLIDRRGKANAMNHLVSGSKHSVLLFSDANVMLAPDSVRKLVSRLSDDRVGAVTGEVQLVGSDQEFGVGESLYYWLERRIQCAESRIGSVMGVDGGMYLVRRELYEKLPEDAILDDFLVSITVMRSGHRVVYENAAKAMESGTPSARQEFARRSRIAAGAVQLLKLGRYPPLKSVALWLQFVSHKLLRWLSPLLFLGLLVCNIAVLGWRPWYSYLLILQLIGYGLVVVTFLSTPVRSTAPGSVLFYFGLSQVAMAVGLFRGVFNLQPSQWEKSRRADLKSNISSAEGSKAK